jgi:CRISPR-associated protein Csm4
MQAVILRCKPRSRFHFGGLALDNNSWLSTTSEWMPSDTLFSAIINTIASFSDPSETTRLMLHFLEGRLKISSGFYVLELEGKKVFFLPKPAHYALQTPDDAFKKYAAVRLISKTVWEAGWPPNAWKDNCVLLQNGKVLAAKSDLPESFPDSSFESNLASNIALYQIGDYPRVKVHSPTRTENFFHFTALHTADNALWLPQSRVSMFFLVDNQGMDNPADWETIQAAIRMLPHTGIGGERAAGCGFFDSAQFEDFDIADPGSGYCASISLTLPGTEVELKRALYYQITTRGGRQYGSAEKRFDHVRMLAEGAVSKGEIVGHSAKIGKNDGHDVYRYGKAFCLPTIHIPESDLLS